MLQVPPALLYLPAPGLPKPTLSSRDTPSPAQPPSPGAGSPLTPPAFPWQDCPPPHDGVEKRSVFSCGTRTGRRPPMKRGPRTWGEGAGAQEGRGAGGSGSQSPIPAGPLVPPPPEKQGRQGSRPQGDLGGGQVGRQERRSSLCFFTQVPHWQFLMATLLCRLSGHPLQSVPWDRCRTELTARSTPLQGALVTPSVPSGDADILPHPDRRYGAQQTRNTSAHRLVSGQEGRWRGRLGQCWESASSSEKTLDPGGLPV